jgi:hypothetical protein
VKSLRLSGKAFFIFHVTDAIGNAAEAAKPCKLRQRR